MGNFTFMKEQLLEREKGKLPGDKNGNMWGDILEQGRLYGPFKPSTPEN